MEVSMKTRQAYSEVNEFISLLNDEQKNKLPLKLKEFFENEKDKEYVKKINPNVPIDKQGLLDETLTLIALLNLEYWCDNEDEKDRLKQIYSKNEEEYQNYLKSKFNPNDLFTNRYKQDESEIKEQRIVEYKKENFIKRIVNKIRKIFHF